MYNDVELSLSAWAFMNLAQADRSSLQADILSAQAALT
jgi:hypothetical protein